MPVLTHEQYIAGERPVTTNIGTFASGQTVLKRVPVARVTASGELKPWAPSATDGTQNAIGLTVFDVDATGGATESVYHDSGCFNPELIDWPAGATAAQKAACFDRTAIATKKVG
ncbi:head decoration protein [Pseudoalteromonas ulvae]|uniref:Head decoration protein n=1 Tax=Pseudoalteromonas ulvae TaxID=107327 RepID=A0A244CUF7_PSEDV|nr:head decoration protein [Pseudoalteromonas ulvae]OUL59260.1 hypothetical protein B1199_03045 [Pseudoalteromonas ulvae]